MLFTREIQVRKTGVARDGGTIHYLDANNNSYYEDHRIGTKTPGRITDKYPNDPQAVGENVKLIVVTNFGEDIATI